MRNLSAPAALKVTNWGLAPAAHSRGVPNQEGVGTFSRGQGARIAGRMTVAPMTLADALAVRAWLHRLRGRSGTFLLPIPGSGIGSGNLSTFTSVNTYTDGTYFTDATRYATIAIPGSLLGSGTGGSIAAGADTVALSTSGGLAIRRGQFMTIGPLTSGGQLVQVANVNGATVTFRPRARAAYGSGVALTWGAVTGLFKLSGRTPVVPLRPGRSDSFDIEFEEAR